MDSAICMDIGGTFIKYAIVDRDGTMSTLNKRKTSKEGRDALLGQVFGIIEELQGDSGDRNIIGIGISSAGQVNHEKGIVLNATDNLPGWAGTKLQAIVEDRYGVVCQTDNDVKCAALGEMCFGNGNGIRDFVCISIGTGVGGAIIEDGRLIRGTDGIAGEVGHLVIKAGGRKCNCGNRGCYEQYASVTALKRTVAEKLGTRYLPYDTGAEWLFERYDKDERLKSIIDRFIENIADGVASLVNIVNPHTVIIGGAVSESGLLMNKVIHKVYEKVMPVFKRNLNILPALMGNRASVLGVSTYILNNE